MLADITLSLDREVMPALPHEVMRAALEHHMPERNKKFLPLNFQSLEAGANFAKEHLKQTA
jgi:hypothetical protein